MLVLRSSDVRYAASLTELNTAGSGTVNDARSDAGSQLPFTVSCDTAAYVQSWQNVARDIALDYFCYRSRKSAVDTSDHSHRSSRVRRDTDDKSLCRRER